MTPWLLLLDVALIVAATARLTRLVTADTIGHPVRQGIRLFGFAVGGDRGLAWGDELATCPHCISVWLAALVVGSYAAWAGPGWRVAAGILAASYAAGHLSATLDHHDDEDA